MTHHRYPDKTPLPLSGGGNGATQPSGPVIGSLAVQASIMEIFDEFTDVISGELKSMHLTDEELLPPERSSPRHPKP
jgi:hypothetical protein